MGAKRKGLRNSILTLLVLACSLFIASSCNKKEEDIYALKTDIAPLGVRDLSMVTTRSVPYVNLSRLDLESIYAEHQSKVIPWLVSSSRTSLVDLPGEGENQYRPDGDPAQNKFDSFINEYAWLGRAFSAYIRTRNTASDSDKKMIDEWFLENAEFCMVHMQSFLDNNFPKREQNNYSDKGAFALKAEYNQRRTTWNGDLIPNLANWYNNRRSIAYFFLSIVGTGFADIYPEQAARYRNEVKRYVKEWVTYSVFPTGESGEWSRNHSYPNEYGEYIEAQGLIYGAYNCATALNAALWFYLKKGDRELVDFKTRDGLWGTECSNGEPDKTIWTASDLHIKMMAGRETRINDSNAAMNALFNYPNAENKNRLMHASWYMPCYKHFRAGDEITGLLTTWASESESYKRMDDPYGKWRNMAGISTDARTEDFSWLITNGN